MIYYLKCFWDKIFHGGTKDMIISKVTQFLVRNIVMGKVTYLEVIEARPELKEEIDAYIEQQGLTIDKTK